MSRPVDHRQSGAPQGAPKAGVTGGDLADLAFALSLTGPPWRGALLQRLTDVIHALLVEDDDLPAFTDPTPPRARVARVDGIVDGVICVDITGESNALVSRLVWLVINAGLGNVDCGPEPADSLAHQALWDHNAPARREDEAQ